MPSMRELRDGVRFLINKQIPSHAVLHRGFGTSVPFILTCMNFDPTLWHTVVYCGIYYTLLQYTVAHFTHYCNIL